VQARTAAVEHCEPAHDGRHRVFGRLRQIAVGEDLLHQLQSALELAILESVQNRVAVRKILVNRADAHTGHFRDVSHGGRLEPFAVEDLHRRFEDRPHGRLGSRLPWLLTHDGSRTARLHR
jgi:hypothetical protein